MADFNSVVLLGRLARDPELRYAPSGAPVCSFSVATNHRYTKSDGQKAQSVTFVDIDAWRRLAELCSQFLKKGRQVLVSGTLKQDRWMDAKTQQPRSRLKVLAREIKFVGPKPGDAEPAEETDAEAPDRETSEA
ncbi:MAG: single-stranded DNA-binding protein [Planctomycetaceae bacterium]|nr:single-stranded DNA-binding protein [Planctomycetaceae bacterium]